MDHIKLEITNPDRPSFCEEHTFENLTYAKQWIQERYKGWDKEQFLCDDDYTTGLTYTKYGITHKIEAFILIEERARL